MIKKVSVESYILPITIIPLLLSLMLLISNVKSPKDIFNYSEKKARKKTIVKKAVEVTRPEKVEKPAPLKSMTSDLLAPTKLNNDLKSLSAGVVSEGSSGGAGYNISQGEVSSQKLINDSEGENSDARATQVTNPVYPQSARARGIEGYVILEITINDRGALIDVKVISSKPEGIFEQVAIDAVRRWTFKPAVSSGKSIETKIKQKVNFELNE